MLPDLLRIARKRMLWRSLPQRFPELLPKEVHELAFQVQWAVQFSKPEIRSACLQYWRDYRFLDKIKTLAPIDNATVLDVGCGISTVLHFLPEAKERYGIDPPADKYKNYYEYPADLDIRAAGGESIPFRDGSFDIVFCSNVIDHVGSPSKTISEIRRVLSADGWLVLTVECFPTDAQRDPAHPWTLTIDAARSLLADFTIRFEDSAPFIGLRDYAKGSRRADNLEWTFVCSR